MSEHHEPRQIHRRTLLKGAVVGSAALVAGSFRVTRLLESRRRPWDPNAFAEPGRARVAVLPAASYDGPLTEVVTDGLRAIGADVRGVRVVLKPNLVEFDPATTINIDPRLVAATVLAMRELGAAYVTVAEGPGHRRDVRDVVVRSGLAETLTEVRAPFVDLNADAIRRVRLDSSYTELGELWLPTIDDADVVVSMPKMKTHHWAGVTLSLKNLFGTLPGRVYGWPKNILHWQGIERSILDIAGVVRPRYAIVDGIVGMEGNGPISGTPVEAGVLVFGDDPVATDAVTATMMGFDPERIEYLAEAGRFLGQLDLEMIDQRGEPPERYTRAFEPPPGAAAEAAG
ncbi:MAG: DUF362 domain-containing protein [Actinobacteria bacterium]|nr:DUF362 domain-containing protein [Actinomycetota bacterium]